jgi:hypothetical protein
MQSIFRLVVAASLLAFVLPTAVAAQSYPSRQVTIVVPFPAGSITDGLARAFAEFMRRSLGKVVIVETKPGQDGALAARAVAQSDPDGYTILIGGNSTHSAPASLYKQLQYSPEKDFVAVGGIMKVPTMLLVRPEFRGLHIDREGPEQEADIWLRQYVLARSRRVAEEPCRTGFASRTLSRHPAGADRPAWRPTGRRLRGSLDRPRDAA